MQIICHIKRYIENNLNIGPILHKQVQANFVNIYGIKCLKISQEKLIFISDF